MAVSPGGRLDVLIGVLNFSPPLPFIHETATLGTAGRQLCHLEIREGLASNRVLGGIISLLSNTIQVYAECIS
jgi:hypothetical protein